MESRKGYSGLYQFGASYNPGKFTTANGEKQPGNFLLYWMASQALWRLKPDGAKGLDGTVAYDWSLSNLNRNNALLTAGLRTSTSRCPCLFTIRCRWATCRTT